MPGRRHKHFRSGDINQELGILLLKGVAPVASVPRPEDFGIDAIGTLLRESRATNPTSYASRTGRLGGTGVEDPANAP